MLTDAAVGSAVQMSTMSLLAAMVDALPQPLIAVADDLRIKAVNRPSRDILPSLRLGDPLALALRDPTVLDAARLVNATGERQVVLWRDRVPVERVFEVTVTKLQAVGTPPVVILSLDDLTEAWRIERMRADFVANASHELRTPLASILGFVETLQGPARDDTRARERFLAIMGEQARRMARLVDDLLSLSRIEQKRHIKPSAPVNLSALVGHVADTLRGMAGDNGVALDLEVDPDVIVTGDHDELVRVAENLIENAIKYGRKAGGTGIGTGQLQPVHVSVGTARRMGVLTVRDYGDGIAAEHLPRLTERFYRIDAGQSRAKGGTGLGLALVKHIMAHHRGRLDIDSTLTEGSIFAASIPLFLKSETMPTV